MMNKVANMGTPTFSDLEIRTLAFSRFQIVDKVISACADEEGTVNLDQLENLFPDLPNIKIWGLNAKQE